MKRKNPSAVYSLDLGWFTGQEPDKPIEGSVNVERLEDGRIRFCMTGNNPTVVEQPTQATVGWFLDPGRARALARMLERALDEEGL